ncbi:hypothetical protein M0804_004258 [Polistes exclamans]|nr:hypothetical protein M0804_004258 [Polistes exclamans]
MNYEGGRGGDGKRERDSLRTIAEFIPHSRTVTTPVATFNKYRINAFTGSTSTSPKPDSRPIVYVDQQPPPPPPPPPSTPSSLSYQNLTRRSKTFTTPVF